MAKEKSNVPEEGKKAPDFKAASHSGDTLKLSGFKGRPVVLYFYPKDDTPGCTIEANEFQQHLKEFQEAGAEILGVSPDSAQSHCKFRDKYGLEFTLVVDEEHAIAEKYGVWVEKNRYGRKYWGVQRATFLIDGEGRIAKSWPQVKPEGHAEEVLNTLKSL
ncbi:MAG: thioredoxin-dependent thiol peroxidase [Candidatus Hydrogenedentes bacterium]|nr:thioredoxin-dependent thiol peroxidase [Candidatus Hydrogenedentota bacterium]